MILAFLRHGATAWNEQGLMQGRRDTPLSPAGRDDVAGWRLPHTLGTSVTWMSSPLRRAVETATLLVDTPPALEPALIEMDWGAWEGYRLDELRQRFGPAFVRNERRGLDFRPPGGESPREVIARVTRWLDSVASLDRPLAAVTHNGVLRALLALATSWDMTGRPPVRLRPAAVARCVLAPGPRLAVGGCDGPRSPAATPACPLPPAPAATLP